MRERKFVKWLGVCLDFEGLKENLYPCKLLKGITRLKLLSFRMKFHSLGKYAQIVRPEKPVVRPPFCCIRKDLCRAKICSSSKRFIRSYKFFPKYSRLQFLLRNIKKNGWSSVVTNWKNGINHFSWKGGLVIITVRRLI